MHHGYHGDTYVTASSPNSPDGSVVILPDVPDTNTYESVMHWVNQRGHAAYYPRYEGSMQSHGGFLNDHPGQTVASFVEDVPEPPVVFIGVGFGSLAALSAATRTDVDGLILYDPWWDVDLLDDAESYFADAFDHHHYLYRDKPDNPVKRLRSYEDLYPYGYVDDVTTEALVFVPEDPRVPAGATEEAAELLDVRRVDHHAVSVEQAFIQHMDKVYSYLSDAASSTL